MKPDDSTVTDRDPMIEAARVCNAWGWDSATLRSVPGGLINKTFAVEVDGTTIASLQRLHPGEAAVLVESDRRAADQPGIVGVVDLGDRRADRRQPSAVGRGDRHRRRR